MHSCSTSSGSSLQRWPAAGLPIRRVLSNRKNLQAWSAVTDELEVFHNRLPKQLSSKGCLLP